jgi:histidine triad (HIT) family protein
MTHPDCLFCKIINGDIEADVVYRSDKVLAFRDINPQAPYHVLIVPTRHIATINDMQDSDAEDVGLLFAAARDLAKQEGFAANGYRVTMNCNKAAGQTVFHLHLHLLGHRNFTWPPG